MNDELRVLLNKNNIVIKKITLKGNVKIIYTNNNKFVIKKKNKDLGNLYEYLDSRYFNYYPKRLFNSNNYDVYEYIEEVNIPKEEKLFDMINLLSILHNKTTYYKNIDMDEYKSLYEKIVDRISYLNNYYEDIVSIYEKEEYMSPSVYVLLRNISLIFYNLSYCKVNIDKWYNIIKEKKRMRFVNIHNNLSLEHYIKDINKEYFISWDKSKKDMPIYDLVSIFNNYYSDIDFYDLLYNYEKNYPLLDEEMILFFVFISIPDKIILNNNIYDDCLYIKRLYDKLNVSKLIIEDYMNKKIPK